MSLRARRPDELEQDLRSREVDVCDCCEETFLDAERALHPCWRPGEDVAADMCRRVTEARAFDTESRYVRVAGASVAPDVWGRLVAAIVAAPLTGPVWDRLAPSHGYTEEDYDWETDHLLSASCSEGAHTELRISLGIGVYARLAVRLDDALRSGAARLDLTISPPSVSAYETRFPSVARGEATTEFARILKRLYPSGGMPLAAYGQANHVARDIEEARRLIEKMAGPLPERRLVVSPQQFEEMQWWRGPDGGGPPDPLRLAGLRVVVDRNLPSHLSGVLVTDLQRAAIAEFQGEPPAAARNTSREGRHDDGSSFNGTPRALRVARRPWER